MKDPIKIAAGFFVTAAGVYALTTFRKTLSIVKPEINQINGDDALTECSLVEKKNYEKAKDYFMNNRRCGRRPNNSTLNSNNLLLKKVLNP